MENEIQPNIPPVQPLPQIPTPIVSSVSLSRILLFIVLELIVISGSVFAGIQIGKKQVINTNPITIQPTISPTYSPVDTNIDTKNQVGLRGMFTIIWGDSQDGGSSVSYSVSNGTQMYNILPVSDENPDLLKFNGKEVQIIGIQTEIPNTLKLISIKTVDPQ